MKYMNSHEINRRGIEHIKDELMRRGAGSVTVCGTRKKRLYATDKSGNRTVEIKVKVKTKTNGNWHSSIDESEKIENSVDIKDVKNFWVFVCFGDNPRYWIVPDWWIRNDIHEAHQEYLNKNEGHRAVNDESRHHSIWESRLKKWQNKWNILGVFENHTPIRMLSEISDVLYKRETFMANITSEKIDYLKRAMRRFENSSTYADIVVPKDKVLDKFQPIFSPQHIPHLTPEEFQSFLLFKNNHHWTGLSRNANKICQYMDRLRQGIFLLNDENKPISQRLDYVAEEVPGMGKNTATAILVTMFPKKYGVWNNRSENVMKQMGLWPEFQLKESFGIKYEKLNQILLRISEQLNVDLWTLDGLWAYMDIEESQEKYTPATSISKESSYSATNICVSHDINIQSLIRINWEELDLAEDWVISEKVDEITDDIDMTGLLAQHKRESKWLVVKIHRQEDGRQIVGDLLRDMGLVKCHLAASKEQVLGLIICAGFDESLDYAVSTLSNVDVKKYEINLRLTDMRANTAGDSDKGKDMSKKSPEGVVDKRRNPFVTNSWRKQTCSFTPHRARQLLEHDLFGKTETYIRNNNHFRSRNHAALVVYPAFIAIRRGYAVMKDGVLTPTTKWESEFGYLENSDEPEYEPQTAPVKTAPARKKTPKTPKKTAKPESEQTLNVISYDKLVKQLRIFEAEPVIRRYQHNDLAGLSPYEILTDFTFGSSIYRAFRHESPTRRYKKWRWHDKANEMIEKLNGIYGQNNFDKLAYELAESLVEDWGTTKDDGRPTYMNIGIAMKIVNLALKHLAYSEHCSNSRVEMLLHVPWDQYTLEPLRLIWNGKPPIPNNTSQGFVKNIELYQSLHSLITKIAQDAGVSRITYEFWAWDRTH